MLEPLFLCFDVNIIIFHIFIIETELNTFINLNLINSDNV